MPELSFEITHENELETVALKILNHYKNSKIFLLQGTLGAGKTTITKAFAVQLGCTQKVVSPTYGLVNEYDSDGGKLFHFDLYRLKNINEAIDIGIEDYLYGKNYCFIEWHKVIEPLLPNDCVLINIEVVDDKRLIICTVLR